MTDYINIEIEKLAAILNLDKNNTMRHAINLLRQAVESDTVKMIKNNKEVTVTIGNNI